MGQGGRRRGVRIPRPALTTEAVAAFGELLRCGGGWDGRQLVPRAWVELATARHAETLPLEDGSGDAAVLRGYGYQFWRARHGFHGHGFVADLYVITTPHRVRLVVGAGTGAGMGAGTDAGAGQGTDAAAGTATARWNLVPLTGPGLEVHVRSPLMTRPDVA